MLGDASPQPTRSGGRLAAARAVLQHPGDEGYLRLAVESREAVDRLRLGIEKVEGMRILGAHDPPLSAVSTTEGADLDLFTVADGMQERGWCTQPQFAHQSSPREPAPDHHGLEPGGEDGFLDDLAASVAPAREAGPVHVAPELAAFTSELDADSLTPEQLSGLPAGAGLGGGDGLPTRMATINALLAVAPDPCGSGCCWSSSALSTYRGAAEPARGPGSSAARNCSPRGPEEAGRAPSRPRPAPQRRSLRP